MIEPEEEVQATAAEQQNNKPEKEAKAEDGPDWENILLEDRTEHGVPSGSYSDAREYVEPVTVESKDLIDYLRDQTRMLDLNPRQQLLAEEFSATSARMDTCSTVSKRSSGARTSCSKSTKPNRSSS